MYRWYRNFNAAAIQGRGLGLDVVEHKRRRYQQECGGSQLCPMDGLLAPQDNRIRRCQPRGVDGPLSAADITECMQTLMTQYPHFPFNRWPAESLYFFTESRGPELQHWQHFRSVLERFFGAFLRTRQLQENALAGILRFAEDLKVSALKHIVPKIHEWLSARPPALFGRTMHDNVGEGSHPTRLS